MLMYINYPSFISPYVINGLPIRWYAVMYIFAFLTSYILFRHSIRKDKNIAIEKETCENFYLSVVFGLLIGARVGSCLFYDDALYYITHFWMIFWPFRNGNFVGLPGMSYHGGVIGAFIVGFIYTKYKHLDFLSLADYIALSVPFAYTWGRIGNFINGELYGRVTTSSLGMIFPYAESFSTNHSWVREIADKVGLKYIVGEYINLPRWPSQLFEAFFEGIVLGFILYFVIKKVKEKKKLANGTILGFYIFFYGFFRFFIEYFRQPDADIGYVLSFTNNNQNIYIFESFANISKGQVFCFLMIVVGIALVIFTNVRNKRGKGKIK